MIIMLGLYLSMVFICRENPRRSGFYRFPTVQILPTNENSKSQISPIVWDGWGQIWRIGSVPIFPTRPRFCDGRRSFPTNENSNSYRWGRRRWISLITNPLNCWAPVPLLQISMASLENLGQTSGDYPIYRQNLGWSSKSKIPDRLRFFRPLKTRLQ